MTLLRRLLLLSLLALGAFLALRGSQDPAVEHDGGTSAETPDSARPILLEKRPVAPPDLSASPAGLETPIGGAGEWIQLNNEATLRLGEGELAQAVEMLERCVAGDPDGEIFRRNLAEALVRLSREDYEVRRLEQAIGNLERAVELAPDREDAQVLRDLARRWGREREVEENHWTEDSDLFELSYDTDRSDILQQSQSVLDHLERAYERLFGWFGADPVRGMRRAPIRVVLYRRAEFGHLTGLGDWAGGAFDGVVRVAVEDLVAEEARWRRVLTHELVHVFVHELGGTDVPGWLNEGLAQLLETADPSDSVRAADQRLGDTPLFALDRLQGSLAAWSDPTEIGRAYAQSLLLVERIRREYGDEALRHMVLGCAEGRTPESSFLSWTRVPLTFVIELLGTR